MLTYHQKINLLHILVYVPFFLYLYSHREGNTKRANQFLFFLGLIAIAYFSYKLAKQGNLQKGAWIYLLHMFLVAPLLLLIGCGGAKRRYYEMLLLLTFAALGYHTYNLAAY
jgi:hypothetical protein